MTPIKPKAVRLAMTAILAAALAIGGVLLSITPVLSDAEHAPHHHISHDTVDIYAPAMKAMHENMAMTPSGNADVDFMRGMIPHHQGAIDMAKIVLEHGSDPEVKKLAEDVIRTQEAEIAFMREWLAKQGK